MVLANPGVPDWDYLRPRTAFIRRDQLLELVVGLSFQIPGHIIEFGVADGGSTRVIRRAASRHEKRFPREARKRIYACDSFKGLPEAYENAGVGAFATKPPNIRGVQIVEGYFEKSLTKELAAEVGVVSFASLDADLHSSTLCALRWLTPLLRSGSLLLFDEFLGGEAAEKRAFEDWSRETGVKAVQIGEFMRDPSGWGKSLDRRTLFQIIKDEPLPKIESRAQSIGRKLQGSPALYASAKWVYDFFR
jgi:hypothetical protein